VFTTCSSYFDYPRSATRCSLQFVLLHQVHNASFFLLQSLAQELFQCTVLPLGISFFRVCVTASSPLVHFSLHIFLIPCSVVHRFLSLLLHSSVDSLSVCCSVWLDSFLLPDSHAGYFFGFHRSAAGQRLLAPFPAWCLDSRLQFWLPGFFFSLSRGSALPHAHSHAHSIPIRFFSESFCRQCSHSQLRPPPFLDSVLITVSIFLSRSCVWIVAGRSRYSS
jgi:hypothetical protein